MEEPRLNSRRILEILAGKKSFQDVPAEERWRVRTALLNLDYHVQERMKALGTTKSKRKKLSKLRKKLTAAAGYALSWVRRSAGECGLEIMITILGERNLAAGKPPEIWGPAGVLKYPHGTALHVIQALPILAWLLQLRVPKSAGLIHAALWSQVLFLVHAFWQTMLGRARFDLDWVGGAIFLVAGLLICAPLVATVQAIFSFATALRWRNPSRNSTTY